MPASFDGKLVVAISSRALFDLEESNRVFEAEGIEAYYRYQREREDQVLAPGIAFTLVKKLLALNTLAPPRPRVEVILLSRNTADTGLRIMNSIEHYQLAISRAAFTGGENTYPYVPAFDAHLFLSANPGDVRSALEAGHAAATIIPANVIERSNDSQGDDDRGGDRLGDESGELRIAFDGDAVLFSDEAERVYKKSGLVAFTSSEVDAAHQPLMGGPFKSFLAALHRIQSEYPPDHSVIRTALVTARSAPAHERVVRTLRAWNIRIDEALFLGGLDKGPFLKAFGADIFFDDQSSHIESASQHVTAGHVPYGVANE
jgi:5'-nucleotidase